MNVSELLATLVTSGALTAILVPLLMAWINRRRNKAEVDAIEKRSPVEVGILAEQKEAAEILNLQTIIKEQRDNHELLLSYTRDTEGKIKALRDENDELRTKIKAVNDGAQRNHENMSLRLADEEKQRVAQSHLITELSDELKRLSNLVESQAATIADLRQEVTREHKSAEVARKELRSASNEIILLQNQIGVLEKQLQIYRRSTILDSTEMEVAAI